MPADEDIKTVQRDNPHQYKEKFENTFLISTISTPEFFKPTDRRKNFLSGGGSYHLLAAMPKGRLVPDKFRESLRLPICRLVMLFKQR